VEITQKEFLGHEVRSFSNRILCC